MANRFKALEDVLERKPIHVEAPSHKVSDFYGDSVFNNDAMREYLTEEAFYGVKEAMVEGTRLDRKIANQVVLLGLLLERLVLALLFDTFFGTD